MKRHKKGWNKKVVIPVVVIAAVALSAGAYAMFAPPGGGGGYVCDSSVSCNDDKYCAECTCPEFFDKIEISQSFGGGYYCEKSDLFIDPDSPNYQYDAMVYVRGYLSQNCGSTCTDLTCGDNELCFDYDTGEIAENREACIDVAAGQTSTGERIIMVECVVTNEWTDEGTVCSTHDDCADLYWFRACIDGTCQLAKSGVIDWRMNFYIESDSSMPSTFPYMDNYCLDPEKETRCTTPETCDYLIDVNPDAACVGDLIMDVREMTTQLSLLPTCEVCLPRDVPFETDVCVC